VNVIWLLLLLVLVVFTHKTEWMHVYHYGWMTSFKGSCVFFNKYNQLASNFPLKLTEQSIELFCHHYII